MKRAFLIAICAGGLCAAETPAPVKVAGGSIQGTTEEGLTVYRGIPFGAPPVGDLRWRAPQPAEKWDGVKAAAQFGPKCIQGMGMPGANPGHAASEDCLYLNVWTPAKSANDRVPVLVWIYGCGFNAGATSDPNYSGERLARKGVVLVSIAYRVGTLGFLAHPDLSAENKNSRLGELRTARYDRRPPVGAKEHWRLRRRPTSRDDLRRIGRRHRGQHAVRVASGEGTSPWRDLAERRIVRSASTHTVPGRESETAGGCGAFRRGVRQERGSVVYRGPAEDRRRQTPDGRPRHGPGVADHRRMGDSGRSVQVVRGEALQRHA